MNENRDEEDEVRGQLDELPGVRDLERELPAALAAAATQQQTLSLIAFDIDYMVAVNDRLGHAAGDRFLLRTAVVLGEALESRGKPYRVAGDEFWAVLPGFDAQAARALCTDIARTVISNLPDYPVTISCAAASAAPGESEQDLRSDLVSSLEAAQRDVRAAFLHDRGLDPRIEK